MLLSILFLALLQFACAVTTPFGEYAGIFEAGSAELHSLTFAADAATGEYADPAIKIMLIRVDSDDEAAFTEAAQAGQPQWNAVLGGSAAAVVVNSGDKVTPSAASVYSINMAAASPRTSVLLSDLEQSAFVALFMEHLPAEFSAEFLGPTGESETPVLQAFEGEAFSSLSTSQRWGLTVAACMIVSLVAVAGIFVAVALTSLPHLKVSNILSFCSAFAVGALLTVSVVHLIPEGLAGLEQYGEGAGWRGMTVLLSAFFCGILIDQLLSKVHTHGLPLDADDNCTATEATLQKQQQQQQPPVSSVTAAEEGSLANGNGDKLAGATTAAPSTFFGGMLHSWDHSIRTRNTGKPGKRKFSDLKGLSACVWSVTLGEMIHNFADGVLMGAGFLSCSAATGWAITAAIVAHELPQEVSDYFVYRSGGCTLAQALAFNFASAITAVLGGVVLLSASSSLTLVDLGYILLASAGFLLYTAVGGLLPTLSGSNAAHKSTGQRLGICFAIALGAVALGLPLLSHTHCDAGSLGHGHHGAELAGGGGFGAVAAAGGADPHAGHNHRRLF